MTKVKWTSFFAFAFGLLALACPLWQGEGTAGLSSVVFAILALVSAVLGVHEDR